MKPAAGDPLSPGTRSPNLDTGERLWAGARCRVVRSTEARTTRGDEPGAGVSVSSYLDATSGAVHLSVAVCELAPGGHIVGHLHSFEESFYVLGGSGVVTIDGRNFTIGLNDFG